MTCWIKIAPASVVLCIFCLLRCGLAPAIKTASVWACVSLALGEKLVLKLFHCVKLSAHGFPLWNSHALMALRTLICNGSSSEKQAQAL